MRRAVRIAATPIRWVPRRVREVGEAMSGLFGNFFADMSALTKRIIFTIVELVAMVITFRMAMEINDFSALKWITTVLFLLMMVATWIIPKDWF